MDTKNRTTRPSTRRIQNHTRSRGQQTSLKNLTNAAKTLREAALAHLLESTTAPYSYLDPVLEGLTKRQRVRLANLSRRTGIDALHWVRKAIANFLEDEAPIWRMRFSR